MAKVGVAEAARLAQTTRTTVYKHLKNGKLTGEPLPDGGWAIDTAELVRVYGAIYVDGESAVPQLTAELQQEIERLHRELQAKDEAYAARGELLASKEAHISDLQRSLSLLEHRQPHQDHTPAPAPQRRGFWSRIFGGGA